MKLSALISAAAFALCAYGVAHAMSTVPYSAAKPPPGSNGFVRGTDAPDGAGPIDPYAPATPFSAPRAADRNVRPPSAQDRSSGRFLNADPFDPNSDVNAFDRQRYANPYPYDPIYNPYGQGSSRYAPSGNVPMGQGIPFGR
jgi:hypothetical protein